MADFIVRLDKTDGSLSSRYSYEFRSSDGTGPLEQEYVSDPSPMLVRQLCGKIDAIIQEALGPAPVTADPVGELARHGHSLFNALFPSLDGNTSDLARRLTQLNEPILVRTNESDIPWELLHDGNEFLGLAHELGRRKFTGGRVAAGRVIGRLRRALIVGDPNDNLEAARQEAIELGEWLGQHDVECTLLLGEQATLLRVFEELEPGGYDLLHYCGHVAAPHGTKLIGLRLHDDELMDSRALQPLVKNGTPPVVFINGCESASRIADLCSSFMALGSTVAVGTLYAVEEQAARTFGERFYADLMSGASAGAAVRAARGALDPNGVAWTTFVLYGDPATRVTTGDVAPPQPEVAPPPAESARRFDDEASELMARVVRHAAARGVVTSMDLLAGLLSTEEIAGRMRQDRVALATELLRKVLDIGPTAPVATDAEIEFSDTVETVLAGAEQLADDSGRKEITVTDLVTTFTAVGGGSSAQLLDLFGITLAELAGGDPPRAGSPAKDDQPRRTRVPDLGTNGQRAGVPAEVTGAFAGDLLFDGTGRLRTERFDPTVVAALRAAALLAATQHSTISTAMLLYGLGISNNEFFGERMRASGEAGTFALNRLSLPSETRANRFSPRTRRALERAAARAETGGEIPVSSILAEILAEETSTARQLLVRLGVDPDRLLGD